MKISRIFLLVLAIATVSSLSTALLLKADFPSYPIFKERWMPAEPMSAKAPEKPPTVFQNLTVIDGSRSALTYNEQEILFNGFGDQLHDPMSAQIRKLTRSKTKKFMICGEFNSKNRLGGYVGFAPFFAVLSPPKAVIVLWKTEVASAYPEQLASLNSDMGCTE